MWQAIILVLVFVNVCSEVQATDSAPAISGSTNEVNYVDRGRLLWTILGEDLNPTNTSIATLESKIRMIEATLMLNSSVRELQSYINKKDEVLGNRSASQAETFKKRYELIIQVMKLRMEVALRAYRERILDELNSNVPDAAPAKTKAVEGHPLEVDVKKQ